MFNYENYKLVDESLQAQLLWLDGVFLMARQTEKLKAELFSLYGFYVEVLFDEGDELLFIYPFENMERLHPYLKTIDIGEILENTK